MSDESKDQKTEQPVVEVIKEVKLAPGLFKDFTLGSVLAQGPNGNVMSNLKPSADYDKAYKESTKNVNLSPEEFKAQEAKKLEEKSKSSEEKK